MRKENKENLSAEVADAAKARDEALFETLGKNRKKKKRKIIITVVVILLVVAIVLVSAVGILRRRVRENFAGSSTEVLSYQASVGTISTVVSGSGTLTNVDVESVELPTGVELKEMLVKYGDEVAEGDLLATVDMATVRSAMSDLQAQIDALDEQISDAEGDQVSSYIYAGVSGRVKIIYAEKGDDVANVMVENGALAVISLDGYMAMDLETDALSAGDTVTVAYGETKETTGTVESAAAGVATILVTDNGPKHDEEVTVYTEDGTALGVAKLYVHNPLAITGYAGTISNVAVSENSKVSASSSVFYLKDTSYSANYDSLLRSRSEKEEDLLVLLAIQKNGGIAAPVSGSVYTAADLDKNTTITEVASISPDVSMSVTITVDESDILSLAVDQEADVTVSSVSEDAFTGIVTEIDKSASSGYYTAVITLDKVEGMLPGMTASVDVKIEGVDDAILIPVEALHQTSTSYYVYTSYDEETEEYGGKVDVTVGLSNDNYVEIKSGLSEGDTVYYTETISIFDMFSNMAGMGGMSGMSGMNGGNSGGNSGGMPSGGFSGGDMPGGDGGRGSSGGQMPGGFGG